MFVLANGGVTRVLIFSFCRLHVFTVLMSQSFFTNELAQKNGRRNEAAGVELFYYDGYHRKFLVYSERRGPVISLYFSYFFHFAIIL